MKKNTIPKNKLANVEVKREDSKIIAVGASAGGLEALKVFFSNLSKTDINTYVVIQHLSPDYKSMMGQLLKKFAHLPIKEVRQNTAIKPSKIYLIPSKSNAVIKNGKFELIDKEKKNRINLPIDLFFMSLAEYKQENAIGIILSGTGSDGTRGVKAIKEKGGMIMVQDPQQAKFDGMPKSALQTGLVDYTLAAENMGDEIEEYINSPLIIKIDQDKVEYDKDLFDDILELVNKQTDADFTHYKYSTLARRLARRIKVCKAKTLEEYYDILKETPKEVECLFKEFLIGVTSFFRDQEVWQCLHQEVIPQIIHSKRDFQKLKIWNVACSTGEEAYSLAISIYEEMQNQEKNLEVKIFATDISKDHLEIGSQGVYSESVISDIPPDLLEKYFVLKNEKYQVVDKIRKMVIFSKHNLLKNPPFSNMDIIMCRNLLIYFQLFNQQKALNALHYGLKDKGFLILGTSESVHTHHDHFEEINRRYKIYQNKYPKKRLDSSNMHSPRKEEVINREPLKKKSLTKTTKNNYSKGMYQNALTENILEHFGGASVLVDAEFTILEAFGEFRKYADLPIKGFSTNLLDMMDNDLRQVVKTTGKKAIKENTTLQYDNFNLQKDNQTIGLKLICKPFKVEKFGNETGLILNFIETDINLDKVKKIENLKPGTHSQEYIEELERELKKTKEELQESLEEIESSNQELQTANEELLASNEELQSTNEELQSVNEEINTVNAENVQKMEDLSQLNADMNNLLESTNIGTIFLDDELQIRKFTPAIKRHFSLLKSDLGRPINDFTTNFTLGKGKDLVSRCERVLKTGKSLERHIVAKDGVNFLQRISPFLNSREEMVGVVITFINIESLQKAKRKLEASEKRFKSFYEEDPVMHFSVDPTSNQITHCNIEAAKKLGYEEKEELIGKSILDLYEDNSQLQTIKRHKEFKKEGVLKNIEQLLLTKEGEKISVIMHITAELDEDENIVNHRFTCVDISAQKKSQKELEEQKADLERVNRDLEQFVSICSHDLQEPLSTIKFGSDILGKIYGDRLDKKGKDYISYIDQASNRLSEQIKALLEHSRIGRNTNKKLVNTRELVEVVKYDLSKRIRDTKARVSVGKLPKIKAYEVELRLLFQNLMSNALKYISKDRKPEIRISAYPEGNYWVFSIMDNGIGISEEDQKSIFTIFNRVPSAEKDYDGTGVGLAHVEKIVTLHEGSLWVDSQVGVGSTFYFKIKAK